MRLCNIQKQPSKVFQGKRVLNLCSKFTGEYPCQSVTLLHIFRTPFPENNSGGLLLNIIIQPIMINQYKRKNFTQGTWIPYARTFQWFFQNIEPGITTLSLTIPTLHPISVSQWGLLDSPGKITNLQNFFGVRPSNKFSTGETKKPTGDDMKIQQVEMTNLLLSKLISYQSIVKGWELEPINELSEE